MNVLNALLESRHVETLTDMNDHKRGIAVALFIASLQLQPLLQSPKNVRCQGSGWPRQGSLSSPSVAEFLHWQIFSPASHAPVARVALRTLKVHITTGTTEALLKVDFERSKLEDPWH